MSKKKTNSKELLNDVRSGMDKEEIKKKYQIPSESLDRFIKQLIEKGYLKQSEIKESTESFTCPACNKNSKEEFSECPYCGIIVSKYLQKKTEEEKQKTAESPQVESTPKSELISCPTCQKEISPNASACPHCGEPSLSPVLKEERPSIRTGDFVCNNCGYIGKPKTKDKGSILTEIILWLFFLLPGIIYSLYRLSSRTKVCPKCEAPNMVPGDSPIHANKLEKIKIAKNSSSKDTISAGHILSWIFGILFMLLGIAFLMPTPIIGLIWLALGLFLLPPIVKKIESKLDFKISGAAKIVVVFCCLIVLRLISSSLYTNNDRTLKETNRDKIARTETSVNSSSADTLLDAVDYTIINKSTMRDIKCSIDVRLEEKVSKEVLREIAYKLRNEEAKNFQRVFIVYYLPGMEPGAVAWASSHFNPNLKIEIYGITIEEEERFSQTPQETEDEIIGVWLSESAMFAAKLTLQKSDNKIFMIQEFKDGSSSKKEMIEKIKSGMKYYIEKGDNNLGEYYLVNSNDELSIYDKEGLIIKIKPMD